MQRKVFHAELRVRYTAVHTVRVVLEKKDYRGAEVYLKAIERKSKDACNADIWVPYVGDPTQTLVLALWESGEAV